ncbi:hypothetical protein CLOM_g20578 [Closterium sp. NIES-68]|nr:hypothetical protein CLOM_g20578 [Closterium sp. NIES-68]
MPRKPVANFLSWASNVLEAVDQSAASLSDSTNPHRRKHQRQSRAAADGQLSDSPWVDGSDGYASSTGYASTGYVSDQPLPVALGAARGAWDGADGWGRGRGTAGAGEDGGGAEGRVGKGGALGGVVEGEGEEDGWGVHGRGAGGGESRGGTGAQWLPSSSLGGGPSLRSGQTSVSFGGVEQRGAAGVNDGGSSGGMGGVRSGSAHGMRGSKSMGGAAARSECGGEGRGERGRSEWQSHEFEAWGGDWETQRQGGEGRGSSGEGEKHGEVQASGRGEAPETKEGTDGDANEAVDDREKRVGAAAAAAAVAAARAARAEETDDPGRSSSMSMSSASGSTGAVGSATLPSCTSGSAGSSSSSSSNGARERESAHGSSEVASQPKPRDSVGVSSSMSSTRGVLGSQVPRVLALARSPSAQLDAMRACRRAMDAHAWLNAPMRAEFDDASRECSQLEARVSVAVGEVERLQHAAQLMAHRAAQEMTSLHAELAAATSALEQERAKHAATRREAEEREAALRGEQAGQAWAVARIRRRMEEREAEQGRVARSIQDLEARHALLTERLDALRAANQSCGATSSCRTERAAGTVEEGGGSGAGEGGAEEARGGAAGDERGKQQELPLEFLLPFSSLSSLSLLTNFSHWNSSCRSLCHVTRTRWMLSWHVSGTSCTRTRQRWPSSRPQVSEQPSAASRRRKITRSPRRADTSVQVVFTALCFLQALPSLSLSAEREKHLERRLRALSENVQGKQVQADALSSEVAALQQQLEHTRAERRQLLLGVGETGAHTGGGDGRAGGDRGEVVSRGSERWRGEARRGWGGNGGGGRGVLAALGLSWGVTVATAGLVDDDDPSAKAKPRPLRRRLWEQVVDAARALDGLSLRVGGALQRNSFARSLVVAYVLALHLSVFLVLSLVTLEHALHTF